MNEQATAHYYGRMLGILSGLFALLQVLVSVSAVLANQSAIAALQHSASTHYLGTIPSDFGSVVTVLVVTYGSAVLAGIIMLGFAWYAGRLTALALDRRALGGRAGFWVALWSGGIWLAVALLASLITHSDGTIIGIFTSSPGRSLSVAEVILLLVQNGIAALIGLGLGALAGLIGAHSAHVSPQIAPRLPVAPPPGAYPPYPPYPPYQPSPSVPNSSQVAGYWPPSPPTQPLARPPAQQNSQPTAHPGAYPGAYPGTHPSAYPPPSQWYEQRPPNAGERAPTATSEPVPPS